MPWSNHSTTSLKIISDKYLSPGVVFVHLSATTYNEQETDIWSVSEKYLLFCELEMEPREEFFLGLHPRPKDSADHALVTDSRKIFVCVCTHSICVHVPQLVCGEDNWLSQFSPSTKGWQVQWSSLAVNACSPYLMVWLLTFKKDFLVSCKPRQSIAQTSQFWVLTRGIQNWSWEHLTSLGVWMAVTQQAKQVWYQMLKTAWQWRPSEDVYDLHWEESTLSML